jgi:hypothetical protein
MHEVEQQTLSTKNNPKLINTFNQLTDHLSAVRQCEDNQNKENS